MNKLKYFIDIPTQSCYRMLHPFCEVIGSVTMRSIKDPIQAIFDMCDQLSYAVDAHLSGDRLSAAKHFLAADCPVVWEWGGPNSYYVQRNVRVRNPEGDSRKLPGYKRSGRDAPSPGMQSELLERDGYRCRYCGIPVVPASVRKLAHHLYPEAVRWKDSDYKGQHAGFQALWLQFDHVVPVSHGGSTTLENLVVTCHLCNFGKWNFTLRQLGLEDPRLRPPEPTAWDGLKRLLQSSSTPAAKPKAPGKARTAQHEKEHLPTAIPRPAAGLQTFFLPGAWISSGYIFTPALEGKERWFKLGPSVYGEEVEQSGKGGVLVHCETTHFTRRGMDAARYRTLA